MSLLGTVTAASSAPRLRRVWHSVHRRVMVACALALVVTMTNGCAQTAATVQPRPSPPVAVPDSIRWVRESAEYRALVLQTYRVVTDHVEQAARTRTAGRWAVILDADETLIDNSRYQLERAVAGQGFSPESWRAWVARREAVALPGAPALLARIRDLGGRIAIVTNRLESECADTAAVFAKEQLVYDAMLCRPDKSPSDKNPRFADVAEGRTVLGSVPLEVIAFVGDNILDFPGLSQATKDQPRSAFGEFGGRFFVVPNPMYGSWQQR